MSKIAMVLEPRRDYAAFRLDPANRDLSESHTERIAESINDYYMLDLYPIATTMSLTIVDGQNRFSCAKEMRIPFYIISGDDLSIDDVAMSNNNTHNYSIEETIYVYAALGLEPYMYLKEFVKAHPNINPETCAAWLCDGFARAILNDGELRIDRPNYAKVVAAHIEELAEIQPFIVSSVYRDVIGKLVFSDRYEPKRMADRLSKNPRRLVRCTKDAEALEILNEIYNFNIRGAGRVKLTTSVKSDHFKFDRETRPIIGAIPTETRGIAHGKKVTVFVEDDLSVFSVHQSARPLGTKYLFEDIQTKLVNFMQQRNLLKYYPIIVDKNMVILDGRRRYEAAKTLGLSLYYIVAENVTMWMIAQAGTRTKAWRNQDYLKHYCATGNQDYVYLKALLDENRHVGLLALIRFLSAKTSWRTIMHQFKSGQVDISQKVYAETLLFYLSQIDDVPLRRTRVFQNAVDTALRGSVQFDINRMIENINLSICGRIPVSIYPFSDTPSCLYRMQNIYNYRLRDKKAIMFPGARPEGGVQTLR